MKHEKLGDLKIDPSQKQRSGGIVWLILGAVVLLGGVAAYFAMPKPGDDNRAIRGSGAKSPAAEAAAPAAKPGGSGETAPASPAPAARDVSPGDAVLDVTGYIIARERIELSPRFMGVVTWIGVKKGDPVKKDQVVVLLDDAEYRSRLKEAEGRLARMMADLEKAKLNHQRVINLVANRIETAQMLDDARTTVASLEAAVLEVQGQVELSKTYVDWTVIRSPINGVVLEKLVDPNELVSPQSFGGTRGPSTAFVALADLGDLQVEIDLSEEYVAKVRTDQKCRVVPEAYPDRSYDGYVAEKAPEANRQKGTLQVKVQILNPDEFLTPELTAKVIFLNAEIEAGRKVKLPEIPPVESAR
jgi:HlyD family secretion protein